MSTHTTLQSFASVDPEEPFDQAAALRPPATTWVPPSQRSQTRAPRLQSNWRAQIEGSRKPWHSEIHSDAVAKAWADVGTAVDAAQAAAYAFFGLRSAEASEAAEIEQTIRDAARNGEAPVIVRTDWQVEKITREVQWDATYLAAVHAGSNYSKVVASAAHAEIPDLVARAEKAKTKAQAVQAKADRAVRDYATILQAIKDADVELGITGKNWHRTTASQSAIPGSALAGLGAIAQLLGSSNPMVTGSYVVDNSAGLPLWTRAAINAEGGENGFHVLLAVEGSENWAVTQYMAEYRHLYQRDIGVEAALKAKSFTQ